MTASLVTLFQLRSIFPKFDPAYLVPLNETMSRFSISTKVRKATFLAQVGHESTRFMRFEENLNYSAEGLRATFPKYFASVAAATPYARQPQKIANYVYANRMGNGGIASNDGWNFRGRGAIQLTGKETYTLFGTYMKFGTLADTIRFISTPMGAIMSAGWFWETRKLNSFADQNDFKTQTIRINGGLNGYDDRQAILKAGLAVL